jgi:hypothetical protein
MKTYKIKKDTVNAIQFTGDNIEEIKKWLIDSSCQWTATHHIDPSRGTLLRVFPHYEYLIVEFSIGDYIVEYSYGEEEKFMVVPECSFKERYEEML